MKKNKDLDKLIEDVLIKGTSVNYAGSATEALATGDTLSADDIKSAVDYLKSNAYNMREFEAYVSAMWGMDVIYDAWTHKDITDLDAMVLLRNLSINGRLIATPELAEKLQPARKRLVKDSISFIEKFKHEKKGKKA